MYTVVYFNSHFYSQVSQDVRPRRAKLTKSDQIFEAMLSTGTVQKVGPLQKVRPGFAGKTSKIAARAAAAAAARLGKSRKVSIKMSLAGFQGKVVAPGKEEKEKEKGRKKKEREQKQKEREKKIKEREKMRLQKLKEKLKLKKKKIREMEKKKRKVVSVKKMDHAVAKQLLTKARKLGRPQRKKKAEAIKGSPGAEDFQTPLTSPNQSLMSPKERTNSPVPRVFVLPAVSSRSSRKIKPTKRFYEEDFPATPVARKVKPATPATAATEGEARSVTVMPSGEGAAQLEPTALVAKVETRPVPAELPAVVPEGSGITQLEYEKMSPETKRFKLFEAPLVVEGKRNRRPSMKLIRTLTDEEDLYLQSEGSQLSQKDSPKTVLSGRGKQSTEAIKRSGQNILRKAKLQLNRAALNRSKADLARSLQEQMTPEGDMNTSMSASATHPEFGTSPLKTPFAKPGTCKYCTLWSVIWMAKGKTAFIPVRE